MAEAANRTLPRTTGHRPSRCERVTIRGLAYNIRRWGVDGGRPILFLHGTQDASITFQFLIEALRGDWCVLAPDWRGHGHTPHVPQGYWFHEFVADLDALMDAIFPGEPVPIVGHSLGGNIASIYAGLRPERLTHLISLDGFGPLVDRVPVDVNASLTAYLDGRTRPRQHRIYADLAQMAERLARGHPRLTAERALFLAEHLSTQAPDGGRIWRFDPSYRASTPSLHRMEEWSAIWARIKVPVLWVASSDKRRGSPVNDPEELAARRRAMPGVDYRQLPGTSHNLHHDAPNDVAAAIEAFLD